jgi:hypothetical protein
MVARVLAAVVAALFLSGCWQHDGSLYADAEAATPLEPGTYERLSMDRRDSDAFELQQEGSSYLLLQPDGAPSCEAYRFSLYTLLGTVLDAYIYEAVEVSCDANGACEEPADDDKRIYGVVLIKPDGIYESRPTCPEHKDIAESFGAMVGLSDCVFSDRDALESAMVQFGMTVGPDFLYRRKN